MTYLQVATGYLVGGALAGVTVGRLLPIARNRLGAVLVGAVAGLSVGGVLSSVSSGLAPWRDPAASNFAVAMVLIGSLLGAWFPTFVRDFEARRARGQGENASS